MILRWAVCALLLQLLPCDNLASADGSTDGANPQMVLFQTTNFAAPLVSVEKQSKACQDDGHFVFLTPRGEGYSGNKAVMLDQQGQLVWWQQERGAVYDFRVQKYKGQDYLTYWVGDDGYYGHGQGYYKMFDHRYKLTYTIAASNNVAGDYHEFSITGDDTALITSYIPVPRALPEKERPDGYIWDCLFQEINIKTNALLFEWRASEHFAFSDMAVDSWTEWTGTEADPWDWFHLNSVEKDSKGNYLIAARYTNAMSYIEGKTGRVLWNLGGRNSSFTMRGAGSSMVFLDPHMARWTYGGRGITLFDNIAHWSVDYAQKQSRGLEVRLNLDTFEARLSKEFVHPEKLFGESEGSLQALENGNYFIGYGSLPVYAEFSANMHLVCSANYSPSNSSKINAQGSLQSYRTYKYAWVGLPEAPPIVRIMRDTMYVSWNGATRVHSWELTGSRDAHWDDSSSIHIGVFQKQSFETTIDLQDADYSSFKLTARDHDKRPIRQWKVHGDDILTEVSREADAFRHSSLWPLPSILTIVPYAVILLYITRKLLRRGRIFK